MKKTKKLLIAACALAAVIPLAVGSTFANSGNIRSDRFDSSGVLVASGENSVLQVESEKLYFDIASFPVYDDEQNYNATVTAEYEFVNPTGDTVKTKMGFPVGSIPDYFSDMTKFAPAVYKGEEELTVSTRHTYLSYGSSSEYLMSEIKNLSDEYYQDAFYNTDLVVTPYKLKFGNGTEEEERTWNENDTMYVRYFADLSLDKTKTRYISFSSTDSAEVLFHSANSEKEIYVLGEDNFSELTFTAEAHDYNDHKEIIAEPPVTVEKQEPITLKDLLLKNREEECGVSEVDWFNGAMSLFSLTSVSPVTTSALSYVSATDFFSWYVYELELAPEERAVNTVVSPIFPRHYGSRYEYRYYLSPAKSWASFGKLEVVIRTKFELTGFYCIGDDNSYVYKSLGQVPGGYQIEFDSLPDGVIEFSLYDDEYYSGKSGGISINGIGIALLVIIIVLGFVPYIIGIVVAIVLLVKNKKNKNNIDKLQ